MSPPLPVPNTHVCDCEYKYVVGVRRRLLDEGKGSEGREEELGSSLSSPSSHSHEGQLFFVKSILRRRGHATGRCARKPQFQRKYWLCILLKWSALVFHLSDPLGCGLHLSRGYDRLDL